MKLTGIAYWYLENSFSLLIFSIEIENLCLPTTNVKLDFHSSIMFDRHTLFVLIFARTNFRAFAQKIPFAHKN